MDSHPKIAGAKYDMYKLALDILTASFIRDIIHANTMEIFESESLDDVNHGMTSRLRGNAKMGYRPCRIQYVGSSMSYNPVFPNQAESSHIQLSQSPVSGRLSEWL